MVVEFYIKPNHQKLGNKWRQKIENQNNADFVTKSRADWTNPRSIFNCLKTWGWNSVPNSRHNFELYNVTWKNLCPSDEVRMYVCNSQTLKLDLRLNWSFSSGGGSNSWRNRLWLFWWIVKFCFWNTKFHHSSPPQVQNTRNANSSNPDPISYAEINPKASNRNAYIIPFNYSAVLQTHRKKTSFQYKNCLWKSLTWICLHGS